MSEKAKQLLIMAAVAAAVIWASRNTPLSRFF